MKKSKILYFSRGWDRNQVVVLSHKPKFLVSGWLNTESSRKILLYIDDIDWEKATNIKFGKGKSKALQIVETKTTMLLTNPYNRRGKTFILRREMLENFRGKVKPGGYTIHHTIPKLTKKGILTTREWEKVNIRMCSIEFNILTGLYLWGGQEIRCKLVEKKVGEA
jgi:hypothetical protein